MGMNPAQPADWLNAVGSMARMIKGCQYWILIILAKMSKDAVFVNEVK